MALAALAVAFFIYFPGQQSTMAFTLATGLGTPALQARIDRLEQQAIDGEGFTEEDKRFLRDLYTCFAKGARLTIVLRQSAALTERYLSRTGEDLELSPRIFVRSRPVQEEMARLRRRVRGDAARGQLKEHYASDTFYMGDPTFFEAYVGLYFGHVSVRPRLKENGRVLLLWRAEIPWEWPTYEQLHEQYGDWHAWCFPLPNLRSLIEGPEHCLRIDDGLGGALAANGLAKPFLAYANWRETLDASAP